MDPVTISKFKGIFFTRVVHTCFFTYITWYLISFFYSLSRVQQQTHNFVFVDVILREAGNTCQAPLFGISRFSIYEKRERERREKKKRMKELRQPKKKS